MDRLRRQAKGRSAINRQVSGVISAVEAKVNSITTTTTGLGVTLAVSGSALHY